MKCIYYNSNAHVDIFPANSKSNFNTYFDIHNLDYLEDDNIEAAIKSITYDDRTIVSLPSDKTEKVYAVKSNISDSTVYNSEYKNIVCLFVGNRFNDVIHVNFKNPSFFTTRKELLSRAVFQIIEINSNTTPNFTVGSPTYIQVVVRKKKMRKKFNIFLDSSCTKSKELYPENHSTSFRIDLPERLCFNRDWQVTLKSLFLPNNIQNFPSCWIVCNISTNGQGVIYTNCYEVLKSVKIELEEGNYPTMRAIIGYLSNRISKLDVPISFELDDGKVKITCKNFPLFESFLEIKMSDKLASILGFIKPTEKIDIIKLHEYEVKIAPHRPDAFIFYPKNLIISCDVLDNTIFGGEHVKLLRMVTNVKESSSDILSFDFLQDEFVDLNVKEFKSIQIDIMNATGNLVKTDNSISTTLQLMFETV